MATPLKLNAPLFYSVMARRKRADLSRTFRRDPLLREFYLDGILPTGETLGVGSYGSVVEVSTGIVANSYSLYAGPRNLKGGSRHEI